MKKLLTLLLVFVLVLSLGLYSCDNKQPDNNDDDETDDESNDNDARVLSHADYIAAEDGSKVVIEAYVQAHQAWWNNNGKGVVTVYLQDNVGGYFAYELECSEENSKKLTPGTKIRITGTKATWDGEVEITDGTFEFCDANDTYVASAADVTALLGTDELINHMNKFVSFKGLTVAAYNDNGDAFAYKDNKQGNDIYFKVTDGTNVYGFCVESYLTDKDTAVYKAVEALEVGDRIDIEGFLYWYNGANPHVTKISKIMSHSEYLAAENGSKVVIEAYVQAHQAWWNNNGKGVVTVYLQDNVGGYFAYELECSEENSKKLTPGTKILITGTKATWDGEVEITDGTFEFRNANDTYVAPATDVTALLGTDELIDHMNKFVSFKGLTVAAYNDNAAAFAYKDNKQGNDIYFKVTDGTNVYGFCVESYLTDKDTAVYKAVEALEVGDRIDIEGFLYWYNGANPHVVSVTPASN